MGGMRLLLTAAKRETTHTTEKGSVAVRAAFGLAKQSGAAGNS